MPRNIFFRQALFILAAFLVSANLALAKSFTGVFYSQSPECGGGLYIRTKTIEWNSVIYVCRSTYKIISQDLHTPFQGNDHIDFKLDHVKKGCPFPYLAFYYLDNPNDPDNGTKIYSNWVLAAFKTYDQYKNFTPQDLLPTTSTPDNSFILCGDFLYGPTLHRPDGVATYK